MTVSICELKRAAHDCLAWVGQAIVPQKLIQQFQPNIGRGQIKLAGQQRYGALKYALSAVWEEELEKPDTSQSAFIQNLELKYNCGSNYTNILIPRVSPSLLTYLLLGQRAGQLGMRRLCKLPIDKRGMIHSLIIFDIIFSKYCYLL